MTNGTTTPPSRVPGEEGVWVIILGDMLVFGLFFLTFVYYRADDPALYGRSQASLSQGLGLLNTMLLLTSSWFVATACHAVRHGREAAAPKLLLGAIACGTGFVIVKFFEYKAKIDAGITLGTNDFYMFYYMFTGIHLVHVVIGLGVLAYIRGVARRPAIGPRDISTIESGAVFWHLVDLLWIVLFALLYLVR